MFVCHGGGGGGGGGGGTGEFLSQGPVTQSFDVFTPQPIKDPGYCFTPSGRAVGL